MSAGDRGDQWRGKNIAGFDSGLLGQPKLVDDCGHYSDGGKYYYERYDDGKSRFERDAPELMIVNFGLLGLFET